MPDKTTGTINAEMRGYLDKLEKLQANNVKVNFEITRITNDGNNKNRIAKAGVMR
jgi:hypothetical protein